MADCKVADETTNYKVADKTAGYKVTSKTTNYGVAGKVIEKNSKRESNEFMLNDIIKRKILGEYELQQNRSKCSSGPDKVESINNNSAND